MNITCKNCGGNVGTTFHIPNNFQSKTIIMHRVVGNKNNCKCKDGDKNWGRIEDVLTDGLKDER